MAPERDLRASFEGALHHLRFLEAQDTDFESSSRVGRPIINAFTSASKNRDLFHRDLNQAQRLALESHEKLKSGVLTERDLESLKSTIDSAQRGWTRYLQKHVFWGSQWDGITSAIGWGLPIGIGVGGFATLSSGPVMGTLVGLGSMAFAGLNAYEGRLGTSRATFKPNWMALADFADEALRRPIRGEPDTRYAMFFIRTETRTNPRLLDREPAYFRQFSKEATDVLSSIQPLRNEPEKAIALLVNKAYVTHLSDYSRDYPLMCGYYEKRDGKPLGGNCEAETKYLISMMKIVHVNLPPHQQIGVQVFRDHVQAVIYDQEKGEAWDLLRGTKTTEIRAPIYKPEIYFWGYLNSAGEDPPVSRESLLIVRANTSRIKETAEKAPSHVMNSPYDLGADEDADFFTDAPIPEFSMLPLPQNIVSEGQKDKGVTDGSKKTEYAPEQDPDVIHIRGGNNGSRPDRGLKVRWEVSESENIIRVERRSHDQPEEIIFPNEEDAAFFKGLKTNQERLDFIELRMREAWNQLEGSPDMNLAISAMQNPEIIPSLSQEDLAALSRVTTRIADIRTLGLFLESIGFGDRPLKDYMTRIHGGSAKILTFVRAQTHFRRWVDENPSRVFAYANDRGNMRGSLFRWTTASYTVNLKDHRRSLSYPVVLQDALRDDSKVTIARGKNDILLAPTTEIEIELLAPREDPNGETVVQLPLVPAQPAPRAPRVSTAAHISLETMVTFAAVAHLDLSAKGKVNEIFYKNIATHWTKEHMRELEVLIQDGSASPLISRFFFLNLYPFLIAKRDPAELTEPNPHSNPDIPKVPKDIHEVLKKATIEFVRTTRPREQ